VTEAPDRVTILVAVMSDVLRAAPASDVDPEETGAADVIACGAGVVAGLGVAREIFGRLGVRSRNVVVDGAHVDAGDLIMEVGGALAAIQGAAPAALAWLERLSAVATGAAPATGADPLERYAAGLSRPDAVREAGPTFRLET
jgi:nicotinate-nucleotide pyrophosphorylase